MANDYAKGNVKRLPPSVIKDIELKNHARRLACLQPIRIKIKTCTTCGGLFESTGNRTCGCRPAPAPTGSEGGTNE